MADLETWIRGQIAELLARAEGLRAENPGLAHQMDELAATMTEELDTVLTEPQAVAEVQATYPGETS